MISEHDVDLLDDIADQIDYSIVGPRDSRVHEINTTRFPYNTVVHIERDFGDGRWRGCSGVLIGPRTVLTAAHCLYNHLLRRAPARVRVTPGRRDRDTRPFGTYEAQACYVAPAYVAPLARRNADYGIAVLRTPVRGISRFMRLIAPSDTEMQKLRHAKLFTIAGYPGDRPVGTMWRHTERITEITPRRLFYTVDTCPGHSGSAMWYRTGNGDERCIVAVHTSGVVDEMGRAFGCSAGTVLAPAGMRNSGVRITPQVMRNLQQSAADEFLLPRMHRVK